MCIQLININYTLIQLLENKPVDATGVLSDFACVCTRLRQPVNFGPEASHIGQRRLSLFSLSVSPVRCDVHRLTTAFSVYHGPVQLVCASVVRQNAVLSIRVPTESSCLAVQYYIDIRLFVTVFVRRSTAVYHGSRIERRVDRRCRRRELLVTVSRKS